MSHEDFYNSLAGLVDGEESITFLDAGDDEFYAKLRDEYGIH